MKKTSVLSLLIAVIFSFNAGQSFAQTAATASIPVAANEITFKDLGMENPGILPTNPFYFFKNITRNVQRFFTFSPVKKAELELEIINQQAAELKKIKETSPKKTGAIIKAVQNYQNNVERLKSRLDVIKETSQNPNVDKLVENLVDRSIKHQELFNEIEKDFQDEEELKILFDKSQEEISEAMAKIPEKFENIETFSQRLEKKIDTLPQKGILKESRDEEMIERIKGKMPEEKQEEFKNLINLKKQEYNDDNDEDKNDDEDNNDEDELQKQNDDFLEYGDDLIENE